METRKRMIMEPLLVSMELVNALQTHLNSVPNTNCLEILTPSKLETPLWLHGHLYYVWKKQKVNHQRVKAVMRTQ